MTRAWGIFAESVIEAHRSELLAFLLKHVGQQADAEDVLHDLYERVLRRGGMDDIEDTRAYLFAIARNLLKDRRRRRQSSALAKSFDITEMEIQAPVASPEVSLIDKERLQRMMSAIEELNENRRRAFVLHRFGSKTYEEIAALMGISASMVQKHITMSLLELRTKLDGAEDGSDG